MYITKKGGFIYVHPGEECPNGFLWCDGAAYSRTEYAELFAIIGTTYGSGDGSTTFNVPNLTGKTLVGADGINYNLGNVSDDTEDTIVIVNENPDDGNEYTPNTHGYVIVNYIITTGKDTGLNVTDVVKGVNVMPLGVEYGGTQEDPIPYATGMEIFNGKYYTENEILYLCNRDSGAPLYHALSTLVDVYVKVVN